MEEYIMNIFKKYKQFLLGMALGLIIFGSTGVYASQEIKEYINFLTNRNGGNIQTYNLKNNITTKLGVADGLGDNIGGTLILYNNDLQKPRIEASVMQKTDSGLIQLKDSKNISRIRLYASNKDNQPYIGINDEIGQIESCITPLYGMINNKMIATEDYTRHYTDDKVSQLEKEISELKKLIKNTSK
jgi:hypothetical protein